MKIPRNALVLLANGERLMLLRNAGLAFEPRLEMVEEVDLELTNFSAGVRHQDPAGQRAGSTHLDELAHGAAIAGWLNGKALNGELKPIVVAADPKTLGQIRQHIHKETADLVIGEVAKDLTNQPAEAIVRALTSA